MNEVERSLVVPKDHLLNSPIRLAIMMLLYVHKRISVRDLQKLLHITPGNLDHHLRKLEEEKYIQKKRLIFPKKISVFILKTEKGDLFLLDYVAGLQDVLTQFKKHMNN